MSKKNFSSTSGSQGQATAMANDGVLDPSVAIRVTNVQELYKEVENPNNAGATILLRKRHRTPQTYVLTHRLLLQRDMKLLGITGKASDILIDTRSLTADDLTEGSFRMSSIGVGLGTNAVEWLTIIGNSQAAGGIGSDLPGSDPTTIRIANVVSGENSGTLNSRGIDIRNLTSRKVTVEIDNCKVFGQKAGIRFANFPGVEGAEIHAEMRNNHSHENRVGCLIVNNRSLNSRIEVSSNFDNFDDNGAGCLIFGGFGDASEQNFARFEANESRFVNNRRTEVDSDLSGGGVVAVGGGVRDNQSVASKNKVELRIEDCTIENNQTPNFAAYGARNSATPQLHIAGTHNTALIELLGGNQFTQIAEIPSDPIEPVTNTTAVVRGALVP